MNDLEVSYNRKGSLFDGAVGQAWQMTGGRRITPTQNKGDYSQGATLAVWVKLTDPSRPIPALIGWEKGGTLSYAATTEAFSFGSTSQDLEEPGNGLEAELAKFKGPKRTSANAGYRGSGYLDFGDAPGQFVEWMVKVEKAGEHRLRFRYASGDSRPLELSVDGETDLLAPTLPFPGTSSWTSWKYAEAKWNLSPGKHLIRLTSGKKKGPNIDRLEVIGPDDKRKGKPEPKKTAPTVGKPVLDDAWHLLAVTIDENNVRLYLDGDLHRERSRKPGEALPVGATVLGTSSSHSRFYLDELHAFERTLGQAEIIRLYGLHVAKEQ